MLSLSRLPGVMLHHPVLSQLRAWAWAGLQTDGLAVLGCVYTHASPTLPLPAQRTFMPPD